MRRKEGPDCHCRLPASGGGSEGGRGGEGGGGLGSVVSVITSATSNWVSRHTAPLSVRSHRLHVLQRSLSPSSPPPSLPRYPPSLRRPFASTVHDPLAHSHAVRSLTCPLSVFLPHTRFLFLFHLLLHVLLLLAPLDFALSLSLAILEAARGRSDLGFEALCGKYPLRARSPHPRAHPVLSLREAFLRSLALRERQGKESGSLKKRKRRRSRRTFASKGW